MVSPSLFLSPPRLSPHRRSSVATDPPLPSHLCHSSVGPSPLLLSLPHRRSSVTADLPHRRCSLCLEREREREREREEEMASMCRSAVMAGARSLTARSSKTLLPKSLFSPKSTIPSPFSSSSRPIPFSASRVVSMLASVESMMPLHSAIASARLRSNIAVDSSCWSLLSEGFAIPL
ncbi:unnamed protein product [Camellia sinensis]